MHRYLSQTEHDVKEMLEKIKVKSVEELFKDVPKEAIFNGEVDLPSSMSELEMIEHLKHLASLNTPLTIFRGDGAYDHFSPVVINTLTSRQEFLTAYTPYQPEIAQGTLQYIFEFQSLICELTKMDVANASMYDGATATSEAMFMITNASRRNKVLISSTVADRIKNVVLTYAKYRDIEVTEVNMENGITSLEDLKTKLNGEYSGIIVQNPNKYGIIEDYTEFSNLVHNDGGYLVSYNDPHTLALLKTPKEMGADIAVGDGQSLGIPLSFGGPYVGYLATSEKLMRKMPGRIVGLSNDLDNKRAFVLTLQAREQHIRREKANSNICSNQSLMALYVTIYLSLLGKEGFIEVATRSYKAAHYLLEQLVKTKKFKLEYDQPFFNEFLVTTTIDVDRLNDELLKHKILGGSKVDSNKWLLCASEKLTKKQIDEFVSIVEGL